MSMRDKLIADINAYSAECKWDDSLQEIIGEILEVKPQNPYTYIQKKLSLRSKFDNSKISSYLNEITMYITSINPLFVNQQQFTNKITYICVQKYQHTKIKRNEVLGFMQSILITQNQKQKQLFLKMTSPITQKQSYTIMELSNILYYTNVYFHVVKEILELEQKLVGVHEHIDKQLLRRYIHTVNPQISMQQMTDHRIKSQGLQIEGDIDIFKCVSKEIVDRIKS